MSDVYSWTMGKLRTINSRFTIIITASLMKKLKVTQIELIQRTYGTPSTYLACLSVGFLSTIFCRVFVHANIHWVGARMIKPKRNEQKGIVMAKNTIIVTLSQVTVALTVPKNNTNLTSRLQDDWDPNLLPSIAVYKNQIKNTMTPKACIKRNMNIWKLA